METESLTPQQLMEAAIEKAAAGLRTGQSPFGCAVALDGRLLACEHNTVVASSDCTAHAEINALRAACRAAGQHLLSGAVVATTCEPCPMCMAALHWARVAEVYFGATIEDAAQAGFNELSLSAADLLHQGGSPVYLEGGLLADPCRDLFQRWLENDDRRVY